MDMSVASHTLASPAVAEADHEPSQRDLLILRFQLTAATMGYGVAVIAAAALVGWLLEVPVLTRVFPGFVTMKVNTVIVLLLTSVSLWIHRFENPSEQHELVLKVCSGVAIGVSLLSASQFLTGWNLRIDQLLLTDDLGGPGAPGRMALMSSICVILINGALLLTLTGRSDRVAQSLVGLSLLLTLLDTVGYFLDPGTGADAGPIGSMSVNGAVALIFGSLSFFFAHPTRGWMESAIDTGPGGLVVRRLMPAVCGVPVMLAWLSWQGVRMEVYGPTFALALVVTLTIGAFGYAVWSGSRMLRRFEGERLVAEAERQVSEDRLRRAVAGAPVPMVIHNGDRILHMSQGWEETSGYTLKDTPTLSVWIARAQPHEADAMFKYVAELERATETLAAREQHVTTKAGEERIWELSTTPLGEPGQPNRVFVSMAADVTARIHAERELRRVNEGLEQSIGQRTAELTRVNDALKRQSDQLREQAALLDLVREGILVRDLRGTIVYWSTGAKEMYGWDRAAALGKVSHQLLHADYGRPLPEIEGQVLKTGFWEGEVVHTTQAGTRIFVETRWTLTRTERGAPEGFLEVNRDISARKQAELSLRDSELRFRAVAETAREGIISADESGRICYWNPGAEQLFGRSSEQMLGQSLALALPDSSLSPYQQNRSDASRRTTVESSGKRADGSPFPVELSVTGWNSTQGDRFFTCIVRDITARKQAETALETKAAELARSNHELEQFAYVASHDLQEPLRMVSNYTQLLGRRYRDKLDADANEFIGYAVDGALRMQDLIRDLLEFARVGTRGKEFKRVAGEQLVNGAVANLSNAIEEAKAEVVVDKLPALMGDATQLTQVFQNLIANALKFQRPGERPRVRVSAKAEAGHWVLSVADNGIGIDPKHFERIFQMFQRLHGRSDYPGTGIGLALCKKIVERHGGRIRVESEPGAGTTFSFTLPDPSAGTSSDAR